MEKITFKEDIPLTDMSPEQIEVIEKALHYPIYIRWDENIIRIFDEPSNLGIGYYGYQIEPVDKDTWFMETVALSAYNESWALSAEDLIDPETEHLEYDTDQLGVIHIIHN